MKTIEYFMSPSSPWTYLGGKLLAEIVEQSGSRVVVFPVDFSTIFPNSGGLPLPKRAPQRQTYRLMELKRWRRRRHSPMQIQPTNFPTKDSISSLTIIAVRELGLDALTFSNNILAALWEEDKNIDDPKIIERICASLNFDSEAIMKLSRSPEISKLFEQNTEQAIQKGVFGAPTYLIDGELFWGQDRLDFVSEKLGLPI
ncbi:MAG: 2-hydroxychromene-2-carboxylate isomerase [Rhodospirillaceae bacterium]|nr:2-hydroxychromene-2-carboxylate isomerase [Rhodospirillaceae bacterium]|tara:strand:- start:100 stop:699 length:600 start_codon:yes stop_codon:yes gene_type:complete